MKILKGFATTILVMLASVFLFCFVITSSVSKILSKNNITKIIESIDVEDLVNDGMLQINVSLDEVGLPDEYAKKILQNEDLKKLVGEYFSDFLNSIVRDENIPQIDSENLSSTLKKTVDIVVNDAKKDGIVINETELKKVYKTIDENVETVANEMKKSIDEFNEVFKNNGNELMYAIRIFYKVKYIFLVSTLISLGIACLLRLKEHKYINFLRNVSFAYGISLLLMCSALNFINSIVEIDKVKTIIDISVSSFNYYFILTASVCIVIGIILLILNKLLTKKVVEENVVE